MLTRLAEHRAELRALISSLLPLVLVAVIYRTIGFANAASLTATRVHVCDLRRLEMQLAGISLDGRPATIHDWLERHSSIALDVLCAVPYGTFLLVCIAFVAFASFRDAPVARQFGWGFLVLNVLGFTTYCLYPAAPPWYFHAHGCTVDVAAHASEGPNLARVDRLLGFPYFGAMYAQSRVVFGSMPSLHCAYAVLIALDGWALFGRAMRTGAILFAAWMAFSAVYLDHHWTLDVVAGGAFSVAVFLLMRWASSRWKHGVSPRP